METPFLGGNALGVGSLESDPGLALPQQLSQKIEIEKSGPPYSSRMQYYAGQLEGLLTKYLILKPEQALKVAGIIFPESGPHLISGMDLKLIEHVLAPSTPLDQDKARIFVKSLIKTCLSPESDFDGSNYNVHARALLEKSQSADLQAVSAVTQLLVKHSAVIDRNEVDLLFRRAEKFIPQYLARREVNANLFLEKGCEIDVFSLAGLQASSVEIARKILLAHEPLKLETKVPVVSYHSLSLMSAEDWKRTVLEIREHGHPLPHSSRPAPADRSVDMPKAIELMLGIYGLEHTQVAITPVNRFKAKWTVHYLD